MRLNRVGMDAVVDLGQAETNVPAERLLLLHLKPLKLFDEVQLELDRDPRGELKGNVLVGERPAVAAGLGCDANRSRSLDPLLGSQRETVESRLTFNPVEFDGIKTGVVELLPDSEERQHVPIPDQVIGEQELLSLGQSEEVFVWMRHAILLRMESRSCMH